MEKKKIWLVIIFAVLVYLIMILFADLDKSVEAFKNFNWIVLPAIFCLTIINYLIRFLKWNYFLKKVDVHLELRDSLFIFFSGLAMTITPGKVGEIWKGWLVKDLNDEKLGKTIPVVLAERLTDVIGLLLLSVFGVILFYEEGIYLLVFLFIIIIAFVFFVRTNFFIGKIFNFVKKRVSSYSEDIETVQTSLNKLMEPKGLLIMSLISSFAWSFECIGLSLVLWGFGESLSIIKSTFIFSISTLAGAASMIPGGLGVAEGSISGFLKFFGFSSTISVWSSLIIRSTIWFATILGIVIYLIYRRRQKK